jgi:hypothetical protein
MIDVKNWTRGVAKCRYFAKGLKAPRAIASQINRAVALAIDQKSANVRIRIWMTPVKNRKPMKEMPMRMKM